MTCSVKSGVTKVIRSAQCPVPSFQWVCGGLGTGYWALGTMQTVWIIDSEQWPRAMLRAELIERGHDAVGYVTAADVSPARFPDIIVVELRGVEHEEVAGLFKLGVPVIGIVSMPEPAWLHEFKWGALLRRPISIGEIANTIANFR